MYLKRDKYQIYYEVIGNGYPLVFIHGLGGNIKQIDAINIQFPSCMIVKIDMVNHGLSSTHNDYSFDSMAEDVIAVLDEIGIKKCIIVGISMGAAIAMKASIKAREKVERLVLIRNAWYDKALPNTFINYYSVLADYLESNDYEGFVKTNNYLELNTSNKLLAQSSLNAFADMSSLLEQTKYRTIPSMVPFKNVQEFNDIKCNVLILWCDNDDLHPREIAEKLHDTIMFAKIAKITSPYVDRKQYNHDIAEQLMKFI